MSDKKDPSGGDLPSESLILRTEEWLDAHKNDIVEYVENQIKEKTEKSKKDSKDKKIPYKMTERIVFQLTRDLPFGSEDDWIHYLLADAILSSLWCGWIAKAMVNRNEPKFNPEYLEKFERLISKAYKFGQRLASTRR